LGPEAGDAGGEIVACGAPNEVREVNGSHTGKALRDASEANTANYEPTSPTVKAPAIHSVREDLEIVGARVHNLQSVDARVPRGSLTVVTGVSGSGKTSLAIDTAFAEGQRRYLESLSTYARRFLGRMQTPPVDRVTGLSPAIAIDQHAAGSNPRSTVATLTEVYDCLRILFARVGRPNCPDCSTQLQSTTPTRLASETVVADPETRLYVLAPSLRELPNSAEWKLPEIESLRTKLLKGGITRVVVAQDEIRLDEEGDLPTRRILAALNVDPPPEVLIVIDRLVVRESTQSRLASSLESAFERGGGRAALMAVGGEIRWHSLQPRCPNCDFLLEVELTPRAFSFNSHEGACPRCFGVGRQKRVDESKLVRHPASPMPAALDEIFHHFVQRLRLSTYKTLIALLDERSLSELPFNEWSDADRGAILRGEEVTNVILRTDDATEVPVSWEGLASSLERWVELDTLGRATGPLQRLLRNETCSECDGARLRRELLGVHIGEFNIHEYASLTIAEALRCTSNLELDDVQAKIAEQALAEVTDRLRFLVDVGLGYLTLDRTAETLSGGEAQRIRLASQLGNRLSGILYVLDEPTIGLHQRDTQRLIETLKQLRDLGNTVLVVEHDRECIAAADHVIELGPGAGHHGGTLTAFGTPTKIAQHPDSLTGRYLRGEASAIVRGAPRPSPDRWLTLEGIQHHNLKNVNVSVPLGRLVVVSGVSGSGKSSLVLDVLANAARVHLGHGGQRAKEQLEVVLVDSNGFDDVRRIAVVDQRPIGRSPRSNAATYTKLWDHIRALYAQLPQSKVRGYTPSRFSFNRPEGRCQSCEGQGATLVEMHFLSDVWVDCEVCRGKRFNRETLGVRFKGKSIGDLLDLEVDEARDLFSNQPTIARILDSLASVGLGYLKLGQGSHTLSGGEAQRVKLASELIANQRGDSLYILDEPTTGLHLEDVRRLLLVLQELVDRGNSLVVIEHHTDVIRSADWIIDLGPGAGEEGGEIVVSGPVEALLAEQRSLTAQALVDPAEETPGSQIESQRESRP